MAADEAPAFVIEEVDAEVVRPLRQKHLRPDHDEDAVAWKSDDCETCRHFAARDEEGRVIGTATVHAEDRVAGRPPFLTPGRRLRGITVEDDWRGRGLGTALVARAIEHARAEEAAEVWGNARAENLRFYRKNGFEEVSSEFPVPAMGDHVVVALSLLPKGRKGRKERKAREAGQQPEPPGEA